MVSTMSASENTATLMYGNSSLSYSITCHWPPWSRTRFSAFTVASPQASTHLTRSVNWIACRRHLTKVPSVIFSGLTPMTDVVGASLPEVLAIASARTSQSNSITQITWPELHVLISWSWMDTIGHMRGTSWRSSRRLTTATDAVMKLR